MDLSAPRARRLLLVDPCEECLALGQRLVKDGWEVHSAALKGVGMPDSDLGLLRLQTSHVKNLKKVKALINPAVACARPLSPRLSGRTPAPTRKLLIC